MYSRFFVLRNERESLERPRIFKRTKDDLVGKEESVFFEDRGSSPTKPTTPYSAPEIRQSKSMAFFCPFRLVVQTSSFHVEDTHVRITRGGAPRSFFGLFLRPVSNLQSFLSGIWGFPLTSKKLSMSEVKLSTRTRGGRESYVKRTNDDERGEGGVGGLAGNSLLGKIYQTALPRDETKKLGLNSNKQGRIECAPIPYRIFRCTDFLGNEVIGALATRLKEEGRRCLTYGFKAWREAKGLDFTYDQISGQPLLKSCYQIDWAGGVNSDSIRIFNPAQLKGFVEPSTFRCSNEMQANLLQLVTTEEIPNCLFSMPLDKSPGSDGFPAFHGAKWKKQVFLQLYHLKAE
ncbi:hypothetical protein F2Q69_00016907 [Brassica cretica]|uniref:Uncharacterized protein n=1 Tax=Brassica cretica TaxID=69181 RepID=A0A8S9R3L1_BRACR|nr:hypothetical protein F2Q69_00016907 [Brassica cretica]